MSGDGAPGAVDARTLAADASAREPFFPYRRVRRQWSPLFVLGGAKSSRALGIGLIFMASALFMALGLVELPAAGWPVLLAFMAGFILLIMAGEVRQRWRETPRWRWIDARTGAPVERAVRMEIGDERTTLAIMQAIAAQGALGRRGARLDISSLPPFLGEVEHRVGQQLIRISVYAPADGVDAPSWVTAMVYSWKRRRNLQVLPPLQVEPSWARDVIALSLRPARDGAGPARGYRDVRAPLSQRAGWEHDDGCLPGKDGAGSFTSNPPDRSFVGVPD